MKVFTFILMFVLAFSVTVMAQEGACKDKSSCDTPACGSEEMMAFVAQYGQPVEQHKYLQAKVGTWKTHVKFYQPDGKVMESHGVNENKLILGGRYLVSNYKEEKFEGMGVMGFDNLKKKYFSTWMDSMCTGICMSEGTCDESGKVVTLWSKEEKCPMTGKNMKFRSVTTLMNNNHYTFEMFYHSCDDGTITKIADMSYTRVENTKN